MKENIHITLEEARILEKHYRRETEIHQANMELEASAGATTRYLESKNARDEARRNLDRIRKKIEAEEEPCRKNGSDD